MIHSVNYSFHDIVIHSTFIPDGLEKVVILTYRVVKYTPINIALARNSKMETIDRLEGQNQFYVTRESQEIDSEVQERKLSYVGLRNLTDLERIEERDIVGPDGTVVGVQNRVRAGVANFENPTALRKVPYDSNRDF